ncbi:hypothetical protein [Burkholderia stabilis]
MSTTGANADSLDDWSNPKLSSIPMNAATFAGSGNKDAKLPFRAAMLIVQRTPSFYLGFF